MSFAQASGGLPGTILPCYPADSADVHVNQWVAQQLDKAKKESTTTRRSIRSSSARSMIDVTLQGSALTILPANGDLRPRDESQLAYWGFACEAGGKSFVANAAELTGLAFLLVAYLKKTGLPFRIDSHLSTLLDVHERSGVSLDSTIARCRRLKDGEVDLRLAAEFDAFLRSSIPRKLKDHQFKAALHLLTARNGANFSVPGSGKTTVVPTVFKKLKCGDELDALFVVGPPSCFGPWASEYREVLGREPTVEILAGGDVDTRRSRYQVLSTPPLWVIFLVRCLDHTFLP